MSNGESKHFMIRLTSNVKIRFEADRIIKNKNQGTFDVHKHDNLIAQYNISEVSGWEEIQE